MKFDDPPLSWYNAGRFTLGIRLVVGQRTLNPYAVVRIHDPQPHLNALTENQGVFLFGFFVRRPHGIIIERLKIYRVPGFREKLSA